MKHLLSVAVLLLAFIAAPARAQDAGQSPEQQAFMKALSQLNWVKGPTSVQLQCNAKLAVPDG